MSLDEEDTGLDTGPDCTDALFSIAEGLREIACEIKCFGKGGAGLTITVKLADGKEIMAIVKDIIKALDKNT